MIVQNVHLKAPAYFQNVNAPMEQSMITVFVIDVHSDRQELMGIVNAKRI